MALLDLHIFYQYPWHTEYLCLILPDEVFLNLIELLNIGKAIRPGQVSREIYNYLSPRKRVSYYFDAAKPKAGTGKP
jgi:hypothetical protein